MPGLVNAHTHLELSYLRDQVPPASEFITWIRAVMAARRERPDPAAPEIAGAIDEAIQEAEATGLLPARPTSLDDNVLKECQRTLSTLHLDLEKRLRRLLWPFQEKELKKYIDALHKFRAIFADFLSANIL